ncbi:MAG: T9SS type A sorting domain-containing protein [Bacteroidetes bacterium]|nr:T9SS type A sorting domain-containing protein [Bacteroidota bacterium]
MTKCLPAILLGFFALFSFTSKCQAQAPSAPHIIYGASPFQDSLWGIDTTSWTVVHRVAPSIPSFTITGITGMAYDPTTYQTYAILKLSAVSGRVLATINPVTGVCSFIGNLGDNFSSITFRADGQLLGATGDGATVPEALYLIDKNTASKTLLYAMGNGADGEVILYNRADDFIYHWSGNGTVVFEKMAATNVAYTPVNIPITGTPGGETFGTMYVAPTKFINSSINSTFARVSTSGVYSPSIASLPDDLRGIVMPPSFVQSTDSICERVDTMFVGMGNLQLFDLATFHWGDATQTTEAATASGSWHIYNTPGSYTVHVVLDNGVAADTAFQFTVVVKNAPVVSLSGNAAVCPNSTTTLTGSSGGSSQWYYNGVALSSATTNSITVAAPGVYNMIKTDLNGCADSASVGIAVINVTNPTVNIGNDTAFCDSGTLDAGNAGAAFAWSTGDTTQTALITASASISVLVTDSNGCAGSDTVNITVNALPNFSISANTTACDTFTIATNATSGNFLWSDNSTGNTLLVDTTGLYYLTITDNNGCSNTDSTFITINNSPVVTLTTISASSTDTVCQSDSNVILVGTPSGGIYSGTSVIGNQFDPSFGPGTYTLTYSYTDSAGCSGTSSVTIIVEICSGIGFTENNTASFVIMPNPSQGIFTVQLSQTNTTIEVTDVLGNLVYSTRETNQGLVPINLENQPAGMYFVRIGNSVQKVLIEK